MKNKPKEYEIDSFEKLVNVINDKNFDSLVTNLIMWLGYNVKFMKEMRSSMPKKYTKDKTNWDLGRSTFIWIDDGKQEMKFVRVKNGLTGEVKTFELRPTPSQQDKEPK